MKYAKPEVVQHGLAVSVIEQSVIDKGMDVRADANPGWEGQFNATVGAYEADE
jgi:hypothetical protein